jgi:hypothetical protein
LSYAVSTSQVKKHEAARHGWTQNRGELHVITADTPAASADANNLNHSWHLLNNQRLYCCLQGLLLLVMVQAENCCRVGHGSKAGSQAIQATGAHHGVKAKARAVVLVLAAVHQQAIATATGQTQTATGVT